MQQNLMACFFSLVVAMYLRVLPWPSPLNLINPDWVLLTLIYWSLAIPERVGVLSAWSVGLLMDILTGRLLGQNALVYGIASYIVIRFHKRLRQYPLIQQALVICILLLAVQLLAFWIESLNQESLSGWAFSLPIITGTFVWPVVFVLLRKLRIWSQIR